MVVLPLGWPEAGTAAGAETGAAAAVPVDRSLRHLVEAHLLGQLRAGQLRPGDRVREVDLARRLAVSLAPVREAIFRLVHDGLLVHQPRRGFFVAGLGPEELEEVYSFRAMLEGLAAKRAAARLAPATVAELERLIGAGEAAGRAGDVLGQAEHNAQFHGVIVGAAGHQLLARAWRMLGPLVWLLAPGTTPEPPSDVEVDGWVARHRRLLTALRAGDPHLAEQVAREHVLRAGEARLRHASWRAPDKTASDG